MRPKRTPVRDSCPYPRQLADPTDIDCSTTAGGTIGRNFHTIAFATNSTPGITASSAAPPPGQLAPAPSAPQNMPKELSITPTANFIVFSGTLARGARAATPAAITTSTAMAAAAAASGTCFWLAPN